MSKRILKGKIVSDKMQKTVAVEVINKVKHPLYGKELRRDKKFLARNDKDAKLGDNVVIEECKPFSKRVKWQVVEIIEESK